MAEAGKVIRFATISDAIRIAQIHVGTWQVAYRGIVPDSFLGTLSVEKRAEGWKRGIEANPKLVLVAEDRNRIEGWIALGLGRDDDTKMDGEIYAIYVSPDSWRRGIGRALMERGEAELWSRGLSRIVLWVLEQNDFACLFYQALRYAPDSRSKEVTFGETKLKEVRYEKKAARPARPDNV